MVRRMTYLLAALLIVAALTGSARAGGTSLHIGKTRTAVVDIIVQDGIAIPVTIQLPYGRRFSVGDDDDEYDLDDIYNYGDPDQYEYPAPSGPKEDKSDIDVRSRKAMDRFFTEYYRRRQSERPSESAEQSGPETAGAQRTASRRIGPMVKTMLGDLRMTEDDGMVIAVKEYGEERLYRLESDGEARRLVAQANGQQVRAVLIGRVRGDEDAPVVDVRNVWLRQPAEASPAEPEEGAEAADEAESEGEQEPEPEADVEPAAE